MWFLSPILPTPSPGVRALHHKYLLLLSSHVLCGSLRLLMDFVSLDSLGHAPFQVPLFF